MPTSRSLGDAQADRQPPQQRSCDISQRRPTPIVAALDEGQHACILPGILVARTGHARRPCKRFIDASGLPFATMFMDKSVLEEQHPAYIGMYDGALMDEKVRGFVENSDSWSMSVAMMTDFNTGAFTAHLDPAKTITIGHHRTDVNGKTYPSVEIGDILAALDKATAEAGLADHHRPTVARTGRRQRNGPDRRLTRFIHAGRTFSSRTIFSSPKPAPPRWGLASPGCPEGRRSTIRRSGARSAGQRRPRSARRWQLPTSRVVLVTGDGSHQLTAQEIGQFGRLGLKPIVFVLNNSGYLIERLLCKDPAVAYNDIASWNYAELPHALGCDDWFTARVTTCDEFDQAPASRRKGEHRRLHRGRNRRLRSFAAGDEAA